MYSRCSLVKRKMPSVWRGIVCKGWTTPESLTRFRVRQFAFAGAPAACCVFHVFFVSPLLCVRCTHAALAKRFSRPTKRAG